MSHSHESEEWFLPEFEDSGEAQKIVRNFMLAGLNIYCISVFVQEGVLGDGICGTFCKREFWLESRWINGNRQSDNPVVHPKESGD